MTTFEEALTVPSDFSGRVRLFPLPNLVLFPFVSQPLHIFEPRYCEMVEEALSTDRLIAPVLLDPGWERDYERRPPVAPVACLATIITHERLPQGRFNLLVRGLRRAAVRRELPATRTFRQAEVDLLDDFYSATGKATRPALQRRLVDLASQLMPTDAGLRDELLQLLGSDLPLGLLSDIFSYTLGFQLAVKQRLLAEWNVDRRATLLVEKLTDLIAGPPESFAAPPFSLN